MDAGAGLTGSWRVRAIRPAFSDACRLVKKARDQMEIRSHALKLRYWPATNPMDESGKVLDLDWSWVRSLPGLGIGELRIEDVIGGNDNLRIIFFVGDDKVRDPLPLMWILRVMQKKRQDFSKHDLAIFKARRALVIERFYNHRDN